MHDWLLIPKLNSIILRSEVINLRLSFLESIIHRMDEPLKFKPFALSALLLIFIGWGGLYFLIMQTRPDVWPRWGFFVLMFIAITGTLLPIVYFFHRRFPDDPPADASVIVRQSLWFGVYGAMLAWLQLGRLVTVYIILGMAIGLIAIEYFIRLRERAHWSPPDDPDERTS